MVLTGNQIFIQYWLNEKDEEGLIINIAGRQRMLSQRINLLVLREPSVSRDDELDSLLHMWKTNHFGLIESNKGLDYSAINEEEAFQILQGLSETVEEAVLLVENDELGSNQITQLNDMVDDYLLHMDLAVYALSTQADRRLRMIVFIELVLFSLSVGMLLIEMRFIFLPVISKLGVTIDQKETLLKEKKANVLFRHTEYLKSLHKITISKDSSEKKIDNILQVLSEYSGLPVGIVSKVRRGTYQVMYSTRNELGIKPGDTYDLKDTICDITLNHTKANLLFNDELLFYDPDLKNSQYHDHQAVKALPLKTYLGVALTVNKERYGTLNFSSEETKHSYEEEEILMFLQAKEAIVYQLQGIERRKLQEENEQLALVAKSTDNSIVLTDRHGTITWVNEAFEHLSGLKSKKVKGYSLLELFQKFGAEEVVTAKIAETIEQAAPLFFEAHVAQLKNIEFLGVDIEPIFSENGLKKFVIICNNITEEVRLRRQNEQLAYVSKKTNNGVIISDSEGKVLWVNDGFLNVTGYSNEYVEGTDPVTLIVGPETSKRDVDKWYEAISKGEPLQMELMNYNKDGDPYWMSVDMQPIFGERGEVQRFVILQTDISERVNRQKLELRSEIRGEEKERNRISRDLHDGVGQMLVASRMLLNKMNPNLRSATFYEQKEVLDKLIQEMLSETRMIINNLEVSFTKARTFKGALKELIKKTYLVFDGDITLEWNGDDQVGDFIYSMNLFRIMQEGISNSIKYAEASAISIKVHNNGQLNIVIKDDGVGFESHEKLMGYGLNNMKTRAENINLEMNISSDLGTGTTINLASK